MDSDKLDAQLERLHDHKSEWAELPLSEKIGMAKRLLERSAKVGQRQVDEALEQKGIPEGHPHEGEEWLGGPMVQVRVLRLLIDTLESIETTGRPPISRSDVRQRDNGQIAVKVFPAGIWDKLMYQGFEAEIYQQEGVTPDNLFDHMAEYYRQDDPEERVTLVLGAGNVASIGPLDCVHKLFAEGEVTLLKMNPVNDYLGPFVEEAFGEFIERGFVEVCYGGADVGQYLTYHDLVDSIHITGSDRTHDAIVFGTGEEGEKRKAQNDPKLDKPISSELGNVSPIIVAPGQWSESEIEFHAQNVASQIVNNAGFNCNAARVIITWEDWEQRDQFLDEVMNVLEEIGPRNAYYPGAEDRFETFTHAYEDLTVTAGNPDDDELPWALIRGVDHTDDDSICFRQEAWCSVMSETPLPASDERQFLENAVEFANDTLWGTLNACLIVHPDLQKRLGSAVEQAIEDLRYGSVVLNHWPAISYALGATAWGAYPGHTLDDIQSGRGFVHNTYLFDKPEKSVIRGPFIVKPKPPWFATHQTGDEIGPKLLEFEHDPGLLRFASVLWPALRG